MTARESDVEVDGRSLRVRQAGDPDGLAVIYCHGTPGSRLDVAFAEAVADENQVRLVSFDRPGYGGSTAAPFSLGSVAGDIHALADALGLDGFATLGQSGGGPFALAAATVGGNRVTRVGVASGAGPFQLVPGALGQLDENDQAASAHLADDPARAAAGFGAGFEPLAALLAGGDDAAVVGAFGSLLSRRDQEILADPVIAPGIIAAMREGLRAGVEGGGWDNVAWIGPWDIDLGLVSCPVLLWYGEEDRFAPLAHGQWLAQNLKNAQLVRREGEGHFGIVDHGAEMLGVLKG